MLGRLRPRPSKKFGPGSDRPEASNLRSA
jgi:hypothetical protein